MSDVRRERLAAAQTDLLRALLTDAEVPEGFGSRRTPC
jgi:hypothetical protein